MALGKYVNRFPAALITGRTLTPISDGLNTFKARGVSCMAQQIQQLLSSSLTTVRVSYRVPEGVIQNLDTSENRTTHSQSHIFQVLSPSDVRFIFDYVNFLQTEKTTVQFQRVFWIILLPWHFLLTKTKHFYLNEKYDKLETFYAIFSLTYIVLQTSFAGFQFRLDYYKTN